MRVTLKHTIAGAAVVAGALLATGGTAAAGSPTCVSEFEYFFGSEISNHGQHVVGDYVSGLGHDGDWPFAGRVGEAIGGTGAATPGASGIKLHPAAPGASFCTDSQSPGAPLVP